MFAEPDYILQAFHTPNDPYLSENYESSRGPLKQWYLTKIQAPEAWDKLKSVDSQLRLAIIDTGIDIDHPDLKDRIARDSKGQLVGRNFVNPRQPPKDDNGHGTHCAGIACATTDNKIGVAGVGFNSFKLVPAKVLTKKGYGELGWIARAITWAADSGCRVESLSLGGGQYSQALQDAVNYAWKKGTIVIAAAGNSNSSRPGYPAGCYHVVAVSATDQNDVRAGFSNFGTPISVGAPGVAILSTMPTYPCDLSRNHGFKANYDGLNGTSMACPVVSGIVGALLAYQPSLDAADAVRRLEQTADNTARARNGGWEANFGHGRVNLANVILDRSRGATVGSFYGQVVDRGLPVAKATVKCGEISVTTQTDGMFRLPNYPAGSHKIEVIADDKKAAVNAEIIPGADSCVVIPIGN
ncbi:MAG: S8 family serine peptidase [Chloroflexi bacterium]|nr:S8 family serine peptidase [Chloroflexota bacterium]